MEKKCFFIMPIGEPDSDVWKRSKALVDVVTPILQEKSYKVFLPNENHNGSMMFYIVTHLHEDDMVVAILNGYNSNVMYELGIRHTFEKPVVCIMEEGQSFPFDIKDFRIVTYKEEFAKLNKFVTDFKEMIESAEESPSINPVTLILKNKFFISNIVEPLQKIKDCTDDLFLEIDIESSKNISRYDLQKVVHEVYQEAGRKATLKYFCQSTGKIGIKEGYHLDVLGALAIAFQQKLGVKSTRMGKKGI